MTQYIITHFVSSDLADQHRETLKEDADRLISLLQTKPGVAIKRDKNTIRAAQLEDQSYYAAFTTQELLRAVDNLAATLNRIKTLTKHT